MILIKKLSGHSGCRVDVYSTGTDLIVRKKSSNECYNQRLQSQCRKQKEFKSDFAKTPRIFDEGLENGLFYFDMEFVKGRTLAELFHSEELTLLKCLVDKLVFNFQNTNSFFLNGTDDIFKYKIAKTKESIQCMGYSDSVTSSAFEILQGYDFSRIPHSFCFGDLTFENIIINEKGEIVLIDFLDSFYDSWMIDAAKILQDLEVGWAWRFDIDSNIELRRAVLLDYYKNMLKSVGLLNNYNDLYVILLLNLLRIVPYVKFNDTKTRTFLISSIINIQKNFLKVT